MNLMSIRLRGFRGLRGLGVEEVFLDLTQLPEEGLIAVCGTNGAGKTTLLDNLHPYRLQPFKVRKAKEWTPGAFNQYDQCFGTDACKELVFEMGGNVYRELLLIDAEKRKQEAYLYRRDGEHWVPMNDGKVKTYDEEIEKLCGSPQLFFTSVFRCQGAKNLSDYTRGNILAIISELLNVDHIKEQSVKCGAVVAGLGSTLASLRERASALNREAAAASEHRDALSGLELDLSTFRLGLGSVRNDLDKVRSSITELRERIAVQDSEAERRGLVERSLTEEQGRKQKAEGEHQNALLALDRRLTALSSAHDGWLSEHASRVSRMEEVAAGDLQAISRRRISTSDAHATWMREMKERVERAERIVGGAEKIREQLPAEANLKGLLAADKERLPSLERKQQEAFQANARHVRDLEVLRLSLGDCQKSAGNLNGIDCTPDDSGWQKPGCRLIGQAVIDRDRIPKLEQQIADAEADTSKQEDLTRAEEALASCRQAISKNEAALLEVQKFTRLLPELESAETNLAAWRQEISQREAQLTSDLAALDEEKAKREQVLAEDRAVLDRSRSERVSAHEEDLAALGSERTQLEAKWRTDAAAYDERLDALRRELAAFPPDTVDLKSELRLANLREEELLASVTSHEQRIRETDLAIASRRTQLQAAQQKEAEAAALQPQIDRCTALIACYSLLQRACSNDGIISLELDDASPSIAALVNDLLRACYGSRFTIRLDTQAAKVDGDMKDVFDIIVFDSETGDEASITEKSGGQTTIIEDAITRGICLYNIHRSDRVYGTLYSDERDGALDADRKLEFLRVKREALRVGTHSREFFISQTPDLVEMADARIMLAPGGARIC